MAEFNPEIGNSSNQHGNLKRVNNNNQKLINQNNCFKCQYFEVTWDENAPHGCSYFQFKGKHLPSVQLQRITGNKVCAAFRLKD